jgi:flagella basal body P-ring formation protein FlgA
MRNFLVCFCLLYCSHASAKERQDLESLTQAIEAFVRAQVHGLPGDISISVGGIDPRLDLSACANPEPFLPPGAKLWGPAMAGVRCKGAWTVYVSISVKAMGDVVVAARNLSAGETLTQSDLSVRKLDLTRAAPGTLTEAALAIGKTMATGLAAGHPMRQEMLRSSPIIAQGQVVTVIAKGLGLRVSSEGQALTSASEGQAVQVRTATGQIIRGIARPGPVVEVQN